MGKCVECLASADCTGGKWCSPLRKCVPAICSAPGCAGKAVFPCKSDGSGYQVEPACDDENPCTDNGCEGGKCAHAANAAACDDDNSCTENDKCVGGKCTGGTTKCDDGNDCTNDSCNATNGCVYTAGMGGCDDGNVCTKIDQCAGGACVGGTPQQCDDNNACTDDFCDPTAGCKASPNSNVCDDNNQCTDKDFCIGGVCKGNASMCDDGKLCTDDGCDPSGGCKYTPNTVPCNDNNPCTEGDKCKSGSCIGGKSKACDDGNICTTDSCSKVSGCKHTNNTTYCNDGNACTSSDKCYYGKCKGSTKKCNDYKSCTNDSCDKTKGCVYKPHTLPCDDGDKCTSGDVCKDGKCTKGPKKLVCDDKDACTDDTCSPSKGCQYAGNPAKCSDGKPCTADVCDKNTGKCSNTVIKDCCEKHAQCDDKDDCSKDWCADYKCVHLGSCCGTAKDCDDGDACTVDACTANKCSNTAKPAACDTKGLVFDFEDGTLQGWSGGPAKKGLSWSNKAVSDGPKGKKAAHLGDPNKSTITPVYGSSNYIGLTSPEIKLAAGQAWKIQVTLRVNITGSSTYNRVYFYSHNDNKATYVTYKSNSSKSWTTWEYDVSAYAGVPFKFELRGRIGGSSSSYKASGAGIFVDEIRFVSDGKAKACTTDSQCPSKFGCLGGSCQAGACTWVHKCCTKSADCNDGKACTTDSCYGGKCKFTAKAGCCQSNADCKDSKKCTLDICQSGKCQHKGLAECCETDKDCNDGDDKCTVDNCVAGACVFKNTCCKEDKACDDGDDKCTVDKCVGGKCNYTGTGVAGCCMPTVWSHSFDDNSPTGFTFKNKYGASKGWQIWNPAVTSHSPKGVLYYGNPATKNFNFSSNYGTATLKPIQIPADKPTMLRMWKYVHTETSTSYDKIYIYGQPEGGSKVTLYSKKSGVPSKKWQELKLPLSSAFKGKKATFSFYFTTVDGVGNSGLGILIDDLKVEQTCQ